MISKLLKNVRSSLKGRGNGPSSDDQTTIEVANISDVVSTIPDETQKANAIYKEGKFIITQKRDDGSSDCYLLIEWIPSEGYYSRFSKRNFSTVTDSDVFIHTYDRRSTVDDKYVKLPSNFWQIFRTSTLWIKCIKITWTNYTCDIGYITILDIDSLKKTFKFQNGGLKNVDYILKSMKYKRISSFTNPNKAIYLFNQTVSDPSYSIIALDRDDEEYTKKCSVGVETYEKFFNEHGQMEDVFNFKRLTYYFGLEHSLRKEAWKFLLGFYTYSSTPEERFTLCEISRQNYVGINKERLSLTESNELYSVLQNVESPVDKDVQRTDRYNPFYSGSQNPNLKKLKNIIMNYCYSRPQIGYTQGMTDLLAPLLQVLDSEHEAFWCFIEFVENNYTPIFPNNENMDHVMHTFEELLKFLLPDIHSMMNNHDWENVTIFTHRWFLLCFQREFESSDVMKLWEACWSNQYCSRGYFKFFIAISIIYCYHEATESRKSIFLSNTDEVLLFFSQNDYYNCDAVLKCAQILVNEFRTFETLPCTLSCFVQYRVGGGWDETFKPEIQCQCKNECQPCFNRNVSIAENMFALLNSGENQIGIDTVRCDVFNSTMEDSL